MEIINIHEAKTRLSKLLRQVSQGEPFIIAKAGRPIAKVVAIDSPEPSQAQRLGFLAGEIEVPVDFDRMGEAEIAASFGLVDNPANTELAITSQHAIATTHLPPIHKDPFDRLLVAQAESEGILLLTADEVVARYPGPVRRV
jgi:prevent-host-death family protein